YVEDRRNCLVVEPDGAADVGLLASLQAALKSAIQVLYQLEDDELAVELLPSPDLRTAAGSDSGPRQILFYESAEGGAGVLRRLLDDPAAWPAVARKALEICHFDPDTGTDWGHAERATEICEAACYDCLLSYYNQRAHLLLDR